MGDTLGCAPITGDFFNVMDDEDCFKTRRLVCVALAAQKGFRETAPPLARAVPLPLNAADRQKLQWDENFWPRLVCNYGSSLMMVDYDYLLHPSLADCCCGLMARKDTPNDIRAELREFPARPLEGLEVSWETFDGQTF